MPTLRAGQSTEAGFTLVEVAVVVVLIGLLLAMVVPRLPGVGADRLETSAQHIATLVRHLYNEAALTGQEHRLRIDLGENRLGGLRLEDDGELVALTGAGRGGGLPASIRLLDVEPTAGGKRTSGAIDVRFQAIGWLDETVIHLADDDGRMLTLHLQSLTGLTDVADGYREY